MVALNRDRGLAIAGVFGVAVWLFWPMVVGVLTGEPRWFEWDVPEQYWPDLVYLCDALHEGTLPLWNPYDRAGYPYYADPQAGMYHPLNWAICGVAGSSPGPAWADARVVIGFVLAGLFGLGWLRETGARWSASLVGATLLMAAPFMRHNWELNLTAGFAWCGAMLWAAERVLKHRTWRDGLWFGLAIAGCAWVGSPPALWQASTFTLLYLAARSTQLPVTRQTFGALSIAAVAALGLCGAVLAPGLTLSDHSVQAGRSLSSIADGALPAEYISAIAAPRSGNHLHVGWIAMALGGVALFRRPQGSIGMWLIAVLAVAMSFGGTVFEWAFHWVPGVSLFRLPHRYEAWLGPAFAFLAAQGVDVVVDELRARQMRPPMWLGATIGIAASASFALLDAQGLTALLLGSGAAVALYRFKTPWLGLALGAFVLLEVTIAMPSERHLRTGTRPGTDTSVLIDDTRREWRYMDEFAVSCRSGTRTRHRELRGYQDPLTLRRFSRFIESLREHPQLAMQLNARWALQGPHFIHGWDRHFLPPPDELQRLPDTERRDAVIEMRQAMPFAYWVPWDATEQVEDEDLAMQHLKRDAPARVALLEEVEGVMGVFEGPRSTHFEEVDAYDVQVDRDAVRFRVDAPQDGVVVINEAWYPGWKAWVDDESTPVFRANLLVRAIPIESGAHRIEMRFEPADASWRIAWWMTLLVVLATLLVRRRKT